MSRITTTLMSCVSVASLISIGAITSVAHAQDAGAESERKLSTVTVTATKRGRPCRKFLSLSPSSRMKS